MRLSQIAKNQIMLIYTTIKQTTDMEAQSGPGQVRPLPEQLLWFVHVHVLIQSLGHWASAKKMAPECDNSALEMGGLRKIKVVQPFCTNVSPKIKHF